MKKIVNEVEVSQEIKGSKFIAYVFKCTTEIEAKEKVTLIKKQHPKANHHCSAYIVDNKQIVRSHDDGEPSSTAGLPMLQVLQGADVDDVVAIVVRYFGGTLLGKGGLIKAYSSSVSLALEEAKIKELQQYSQYAIRFPYAYTSVIEHLLQSHGEITDRIFDEQMTIILNLLDIEDIRQKCMDFTKGECQFELLAQFWN